MCFNMGNEIPTIFICLKTQCAFRRQPLFLRTNNRTCNQRLCPLLTQRKRKSLIAGFCSSQFLLSTKGETFSHLSTGFHYFSANRRKTAPTFSSRSVGFQPITESITTRIFFSSNVTFGFLFLLANQGRQMHLHFDIFLLVY